MLKKIRSALRAFREGRGRDLLHIVRERWDSEVLSYGLRRDLSVPHSAPGARIDVSVRLLRREDVPRILEPHEPGITEEDREEIQTRLQVVEAEIHTCYVAVTADGVPCFMQWLIGPEENSKVQAYYKGIFPMVKPDEVMLEGAFTPGVFRGKGIMAHVMSKL